MAINLIRLNLELNSGGNYTITSPDIPGLVTEGSTPAEIVQNVQEAIDALKAAWEELGLEPPIALRPPLTKRPNKFEIETLVAV